jgi:hypothetical protein
MLKLREIQRIEKHIADTKISGKEVDETTFGVLKKFLTDRLIECIGSKDRAVRTAAVRASGLFTSLKIEHQSRVLFAMSSKM